MSFICCEICFPTQTRSFACLRRNRAPPYLHHHHFDYFDLLDLLLLRQSLLILCWLDLRRAPKAKFLLATKDSEPFQKDSNPAKMKKIIQHLEGVHKLDRQLKMLMGYYQTVKGLLQCFERLNPNERSRHRRY